MISFPYGIHNSTKLNNCPCNMSAISDLVVMAVIRGL